MRRLSGLIVFLVVALAMGIAQESKRALPMVSSAQVPLYPLAALITKTEGIVRVTVTTDGHRVVTATANKDAHPLLARGAEDNAKTWQFTVHYPTRFTIIYRYNLVNDIEASQNNPRVVLRLPTEVEVNALPFSTLDLPAKITPERSSLWPTS